MARRGRVLKANLVVPSDGAVPWDPPRDPDEPAGEVEVIRENEKVCAVRVQCRCGRVHELELVGPEEGRSEHKEDK